MTYSDEYGKVALFVLLKNRHTNRHLMVCSTHLYWDRNRSDVQLQELHQLHATFCRLKIYWDAKIGEDIPSIICGDFNNTPKSKVYSFMTSEFGKPLLQFRSAFDTYAATTSMHTASPERTPFPGAQVHGPEYEPPFTTITHKRAIPVDFIWYSTNQLQVKALSQIPTEEELRAEEGPTGWKTKYFGTEGKLTLPSLFHRSASDFCIVLNLIFDTKIINSPLHMNILDSTSMLNCRSCSSFWLTPLSFL